MHCTSKHDISLTKMSFHAYACSCITYRLWVCTIGSVSYCCWCCMIIIRSYQWIFSDLYRLCPWHTCNKPCSTHITKRFALTIILMFNSWNLFAYAKRAQRCSYAMRFQLLSIGTMLNERSDCGISIHSLNIDIKNVRHAREIVTKQWR